MRKSKIVEEYIHYSVEGNHVEKCTITLRKCIKVQKFTSVLKPFTVEMSITMKKSNIEKKCITVGSITE